MTPRERFLATMRFEPFDRPPLAELGTWDTTEAIWLAQTGMSRETVFAWEGDCDLKHRIEPDFAFRPAFEEKVVAEDETTFTKIDRMGLTYRQFKDNPDTSMPDYVGFPVTCRADWEALKARLDPTDPARYPADWDEQIAMMRTDGSVVNCYGLAANYYGGPSLFGFCRMLMGPEALLYAVYDEPAMIEDMMEFATEFALTVLDKALTEAPITYVQFWEDMCYRTGPLLSPAMFKQFMVPRYQRITERIRQAGIDVIFVDSDGDVSQLVPLWLESGINGLFPMEQAADHCDLRAYRKEYGKDLLIMGGIDKRVLAQDEAAIRRELEDKLPLAFEGGYIPTLDHWIPPDVTYDNFMIYWNLKKQMLGV